MMLGRFFKLFERKSDAYDALLGIGIATAANIAVSPELALKCVPVYRGASVRCEVLGSLPFLLYERREDGGKDRATSHPLYALMHDRPNAWTSAADFVMSLEMDCLQEGAGYALANRAGDKIVELIRLAPRSVKCEHDEATLEPKYEVTLKNGTKRNYRWQDILHVPSLGGMAPIKQAREAIGLCMAMERHAGALFGNGARPAGVLKFKRKLDDAVHARLTVDGRTAIDQTWVDADQCSYFGIAFSNELLLRAVGLRGWWGMLSEDIILDLIERGDLNRVVGHG